LSGLGGYGSISVTVLLFLSKSTNVVFALFSKKEIPVIWPRRSSKWLIYSQFQTTMSGWVVALTEIYQSKLRSVPMFMHWPFNIFVAATRKKKRSSSGLSNEFNPVNSFPLVWKHLTELGFKTR
jgi:hypothetical protein